MRRFPGDSQTWQNVVLIQLIIPISLLGVRRLLLSHIVKASLFGEGGIWTAPWTVVRISGRGDMFGELIAKGSEQRWEVRRDFSMARVLLCSISTAGVVISAWTPKSGICESFMTPHFPSLPKSNESLLLLFSHQVMYDSFWPHGLQHARLSCLSPSPRVCLSSCPLHRWLHPTTKFYWIHSLYRQQLDPVPPSSVELPSWGVSTYLLRLEKKPCFQIVPVLLGTINPV